ncbi:hypothetical protein [Formosa algae]|uniref:hypothetical protein n=1 Tax=Formosa algae TaxID=225843 RepID=UPI0011AFB63A|nr:hypothetical protein [Formosa algae]
MAKIDGIEIDDELFKEFNPVVFDFDSDSRRLIIIKKDGKEIYMNALLGAQLFKIIKFHFELDFPEMHRGVPVEWNH